MSKEIEVGDNLFWTEDNGHVSTGVVFEINRFGNYYVYKDVYDETGHIIGREDMGFVIVGKLTKGLNVVGDEIK